MPGTVPRLSSAQRALRRRQVHQVVRRPAHERAKIAHLAAPSFMPASGGLAFDSPLVPFGQVILVVLGRHAQRGQRHRHVAYLATITSLPPALG